MHGIVAQCPFAAVALFPNISPNQQLPFALQRRRRAEEADDVSDAAGRVASAKVAPIDGDGSIRRIIRQVKWILPWSALLVGRIFAPG